MTNKESSRTKCRGTSVYQTGAGNKDSQDSWPEIISGKCSGSVSPLPTVVIPFFNCGVSLTPSIQSYSFSEIVVPVFDTYSKLTILHAMVSFMLFPM